VDKRNARILKSIKTAREQLDTAMAALMEKAARSLEKEDLEEAVKDFYQVLSLDPDAKEAQARLATLKPRILAHAKRLHQQGIDFYVNDKLDEAMDCWRRALALDPSDHENVKRDLEKAQKLKDLRR
jgi:tetratricopeptide (TPR) repeat protein